MSAYTLKIDYDNEIKKLPNIKNYDDFLAAVSKKLFLNPTHCEFSYIDEDGDKISLSTSEEFDDLLRNNPKIPKIMINLVKEGEEPVDIASSFLNIDMTVSVFERPSIKNDSASQNSNIDESNNKVQEIAEEHKEEVKEELKEDFEAEDFEAEEVVEESELFYEVVPEGEIKHEENKSDQNKELHLPVFDEKGTSTSEEIKLNTNSIQTQSVENANVSTDVDNLIHNLDENLGTPSIYTEDKSNQKEIKVVDCASDPLEVSKSHQEVNTIAFEEIKDNSDKQKLYSQEELDQKLSEIVKHLMKEMTPMMIEECHKIIKQNESESSQKNNKDMELYHEEVHNSNSLEKNNIKEGTVNSFCDNCDKNSIFEIVFRCRSCKKETKSVKNNSEEDQKKEVDDQSDSEKENLDYKMKQLISSDNDDSKILDKDPKIIEENKDEIEFPEMVKRSYVGEYKPFSEYKMKQLKSAKIFPENAVFTINKNCDFFPFTFEIQNSDIENNTRWPICVSLTCLSPSQDALKSCTVTNKEVRAGEVMKFETKIKNSKSEDIIHYIFTLQDEFGRTFGGDFELEVKCIDLDIVEMKKPSPEKKPPVVVKPHKADTEYKNELVTLKEMGVELTNKVKDLVVKCKGRLDEVFEQI